MTTYSCGSPRRVRTLLGAALAVLVGALAFMTVGATPASASTNHVVTLGLSDTRVNIGAGDSVTFEVIGGVYRVSASVGTGTPVTYNQPGTYQVTWKVQKLTSVLGPLGNTVSSLITVATCAATVVVAPVAAKVSTVLAKVAKVVPKVHVSVSLPPVHASVSTPALPGATSPAAGAPVGSGSGRSGQAGGLTTTTNHGANTGGPARSSAATVAGAAPTSAAAIGAGGGYANNAPAGNSYVPVSMNEPDAATARPTAQG